MSRKTDSALALAQTIRVSLCVKDPQKTALLIQKMGRMEQCSFLKPIWDQPELAWAADLIVLTREDIAVFQKWNRLAFCPSILLCEDGEGSLSRSADLAAPNVFSTFSLDSPELETLLQAAAQNTRVLLGQWYSGKAQAPLAQDPSSDMPALPINEFIDWIQSAGAQKKTGLCRMLGAMFVRWAGVQRAFLGTWSRQGEMEIFYGPHPSGESKPWKWDRSEPWLLELENCKGLARRENAPAQVLRWMHALDVEYMLPLRHETTFLGVLGFAQRSNRLPFMPKDFQQMELLAAWIGQALYLADQAVVSSQTLVQQQKDPAGISKAALRKVQLDSIGAMAMRSSHELKNCLVSIRTFTQLFPEKYADEQFRKDFYGVVSKEVERLNGLIEKLLFFAQPVQLKLSQENITEWIGEVLSLFAPEDLRNIQIQKVFSHKQPTLWIDRQQMRAVLYHILQNSLQAMGNGGKIILVTEDHAHGQFADGVLVLRVVDTGRGLAGQDKDEPFEPFFSTKARGLGLGLTIARRIVEEHGGSIHLESGKENKGTEVILVLPRRIPSMETSVIAKSVPMHN